MKPSLSLLLPTRGRAELVSRLFKSVVRTAEHPDRLEVLLFVDRDDTPSRDMESEDLVLKRIVGHRVRMGAMNQACYEAASGDAVMLINDDAVCQTPGWDTRILDVLREAARGIGMVWCNDLFREQAMPNFPAVTRRACELMGGVCPPDYLRDYVDTHLYDIFRKLERLGHRQWVYLPDVVIEHLHVEAGKGDPDATSHKPRRSADELTYIAWDEQRQIIAKAMARHIEEGA